MQETPQQVMADLLRQEERNLNAEIEADALSLCLVFTQSFLRWQEKSGTIKDLSFTGGDVIKSCFAPLYRFLSADDQVPRKVKSEILRTTLAGVSIPFFETTHKRVSDKRMKEQHPSCHWEFRRIRLRLQAYDILLSHFPLVHETLGQMGYDFYNAPVRAPLTLQNLKAA